MTGYLIEPSGEYELPKFISWDVCHTIGEPCDYFEVCFPYIAGQEIQLNAATRFKLVHDSHVVFLGLIDDYCITISEKGALVSINGRSLAALLLDNEAEAAEYATVSLATIIQNHVTPYGISNIDSMSMPALSQFTVRSGESQWSVLKRFCRYSANVQPRFSQDGVLMLNNRVISTEIVGDTYNLKVKNTRYGVISSVLVKNRVAGTSYTVNNSNISGASCRRILNVPEETGAEAMRYTGEYQIAESMRGKRYAEIALPRLFVCFPGYNVNMLNDLVGLSGTHTVIKTRCWGNANGAGTVITMAI